MTTERDRTGGAPKACRSCGSDRLSLRGSKRGEFLKRDFDFWHCAACDYLFVEPFPGYAIYDEAYYEGRGPDPYVDYESEYRDYRSTDRMIEFEDLWRIATAHIEKTVPARAVDWLDFGCGAGGLLKFLGDRRELRSAAGHWPIRASGHDVGTYADRLRARDGLRILSLAQLEAEPAASYDIISLIEVIEHVEYPDPVLALAARLLRPGGLLLMTTGNADSPVVRMKGLSYAYFLPEIHVGYFTPRALGILYARHSLRPVRFRFDGAVRFKVLKTLRFPGRRRLARAAMGLPLVVRMIDGLFGTSRMPCAVKPG